MPHPNLDFSNLARAMFAADKRLTVAEQNENHNLADALRTLGSVGWPSPAAALAWAHKHDYASKCAGVAGILDGYDPALAERLREAGESLRAA
jgi:hypothetical protein